MVAESDGAVPGISMVRLREEPEDRVRLTEADRGDARAICTEGMALGGGGIEEDSE